MLSKLKITEIHWKSSQNYSYLWQLHTNTLYPVTAAILGYFQLLSCHSRYLCYVWFWQSFRLDLLCDTKARILAGIEPVIFHLLSKYVNHYITAVTNCWNITCYKSHNRAPQGACVKSLNINVLIVTDLHFSG